MNFIHSGHVPHIGNMFLNAQEIWALGESNGIANLGIRVSAQFWTLIHPQNRNNWVHPSNLSIYAIPLSNPLWTFINLWHMAFGIPPGGSDLFFILSREEQLVVIIGVMKPHMDEYTKFHQNLHKIMSKMVNSYVFDDFKRITCQFHP